MKVMKGIMLGTLITAGAVMLYTESTKNNKKMLMKKGKKILKSMGM